VNGGIRARCGVKNKIKTTRLNHTNDDCECERELEEDWLFHGFVFWFLFLVDENEGFIESWSGYAQVGGKVTFES
jgi:hypothetical protein